MIGCSPPSVAAPSTTTSREGSMVYISNRAVKVGLNLAKGGSITYLSKAGSSENLINDHDLGRQVQMSFYSGPTPFGTASPDWQGWGWNPIGSGDAYGNGAPATAQTEAGTLHIRTTPYQWALRATKCECRFESWISLDGAKVAIRSRLVNARSDRTQYPAQEQELPAVYTIGRFRKLLSYTGPRPFTNDRLSTLPSRFPWSVWTATESWAAFVDDAGWGVGVINPSSQSFGGGFYGPLKDGGSKDPQTGFLRPGMAEIIDHNITYGYQYVLMLGSAAEIRDAARRMRMSDPRPDYRFKSDRQHWVYANARDTGWPIKGRLIVDTSSLDPQLIGPVRIFAASSAPTLKIRAAFSGKPGSGQLFWSTSEHNEFAQERSQLFPVMSDGKIRTYTINLAANPQWQGSILQLRFDPPPGGAGAHAEICAISVSDAPC